MGAGEHFLQQDIAFAQPLEQRDRVGAQDLAGFLHFGHRRDRDLARLVDRRPRGLLEILQRLVDGAGGQFAGGGDRPRDVGAVASSSIARTPVRGFRSISAHPTVTRSISTVSWLVLAPMASTSDAALAVDHLRQTIGLLLHIGDDFVGLAGHGGAESAAGGENRAFDFRGGRLDLGTDFVRRGHQRVLRIEGAGRDIVGGVGGDRRRASARYRSEIALIWLAASADVAVSELCASRALLRMEAAVSAPTAVSVRSTSIASDLTWLAASDDAATSVLWASRAPAVIESAVELPAIDSERWTSAASDLTWLVASAEAVTRVVWASRAPAVIDSAVEVPAIDSDRWTSAASDLTWLAASDEAVTSVVWASRAPARIDSAVALPAAVQRALDIGGQRFDLAGGIGGGGDQRGLGFARARDDRPGGCGAGGRERSFDVGRQRLDLGGGVGGGRHQGGLGIAGAGQDRVRRAGADGGEGALDFRRGQLQLGADIGGNRKQRLLRGARAGLNGFAGIDHKVGQRAFRILDVGLDPERQFLGAGHQAFAGLPSAALDAAGHGFDARTQEVFELRDAHIDIGRRPRRPGFRCPDGFPGTGP